VEAPYDVPFEDNHFLSLVEDLETDRFARLKSLELHRLTVGYHQSPLLANMLKENTTLEELSLSLNIPEENADECCVEIIDAMSHNNVLRNFLNDHWYKLEQHVLPQTKIRQNQMLQRNTTLEKFDLFQYDYDADESSLTDAERQKNLLLRLNKAGRKRLVNVGAGSANDWIDVISHKEVRDDLPSLFHLLRMNPSLCLGYCANDKLDAENETDCDLMCGDDECNNRPTKRQCR